MHLLIFGLGYSARYSLEFLEPHIDSVAATTRSPEKARWMQERGIVPILFDGEQPSENVIEALDVATHVRKRSPPASSAGSAISRRLVSMVTRAGPG